MLWSETVTTLQDGDKFDCYPENGVSENKCVKRGCLWQQSDIPGVPQCYYNDASKFGYSITSQTNTDLGEKIQLKQVDPNSTFPYPNPIVDPIVEIEQHTDSIIRIKFSDPNNKRFEVPVGNLFPKPKTKPKSVNYRYSVSVNLFSINLVALRDNATKQNVIWSTEVGALMLADQYLQISTRLPSSNLYGIGEINRGSFRHNMSTWKRIGMFSRDQPPLPNSNLYGVHPFYMVMEDDGNAHGVLLLNSNAMEIAIQPTPALTYRTIGGILDFYFFMGPTPEDVIAQYTSYIGRPTMPAYWSLGFQLCKYGYNSLETVRKTVERMKNYGIPQDVQYGDIDYMERQLDFTYNNVTYNGLPEFVRKIKSDGVKYISILDPAISANETGYEAYDLGVSTGVFLKTENGKDILFGKVWPDYPNVTVNTSWPWEKQVKYFRAEAAFPDWFHSNIEKWWTVLIKKFHKVIEFDGLWIDMNEPANFVEGSTTGCPNNTYEKPPYKPNVLGATLADKTVCMSAKHEDGSLEYDYHSLFGWKQAEVTKQALEETVKKRGIVISRSTYPSSGRYTGHWLGDNKSEWPQLHESIIGMFDFGMFGIPYVGADICGFFKDTTVKLCRRWMQLGAFYPFSRNHNGLGFKDQDPAVFGPEFASQSKAILETRYSLLPYLYTLFWHANQKGSTVVRPLMNEFPKDKKTWNLDRQFMWGPSLLITPVLEEDSLTVDAYLPKARWYDFFTNKEVDSTKTGLVTQLDVPLNSIGLHIRGGHIIPMQQPARNTMLSRKLPMSLLVALSDKGSAFGELFWDDGEAIDIKEFLAISFNAGRYGVNISVVTNTFENVDKLYFERITILGLKKTTLKSLCVNGAPKEKMKIDKEGNLDITDLNLPIEKNHTITWEFEKSSSGSHKESPLLTIMYLSLFMAYFLY